MWFGNKISVFPIRRAIRVKFSIVTFMIPPGTLVEFFWWTDYKAPSLNHDEYGHTIWIIIKPGDRGIILSNQDNENVIVFISGISLHIMLHESMLEIIDY